MPVVVLSSSRQTITAIITIEEKNIIFYYKAEYRIIAARNENKYLNALMIIENKQ